MDRRIDGRALVAGSAEGPVLFSTEPLSFWGGWDPKTGEIIDRRHPLSGRCGTGSVLVIPFTRGSSTTTAILLESVRSGTAPAAVLCTSPDPFLALAAVVAQELYDIVLPVVLVPADRIGDLEDATGVRVNMDGTVEVDPDA